MKYLVSTFNLFHVETHVARADSLIEAKANLNTNLPLLIFILRTVLIIILNKDNILFRFCFF